MLYRKVCVFCQREARRFFMDSSHLQIVLIFSIGFSLASLFGYLAQRFKLSPILGFMLAGYVIGPFSPGYVADINLAEQLAEIGVILMMFGVGLHFKLQDLLSVKSIAIPGALGQTLISALCGALLVHFLGWTTQAGIIIGLSIGVASTVVLVRMLSDYDLLYTPQGHVAVGWLVLEDIFTVIILLLLPLMVTENSSGVLSAYEIGKSLIVILAKFATMVAFMATAGRWIVGFIMKKVAFLRSHELFTITVLALTFAIATGSSYVFGTSIALGAFIAGMIIGQTHVRHQALANALPMKDSFVVVFFITVGMLFNPSAILDSLPLFLGVLGIILFVKPIIAFLLVVVMRYPLKIALTVAIALAQIGEFSFILSEEALKLHLIPDAGYDVIVACALISISLNSILFKSIEPIVAYLDRRKAARLQEASKQEELPSKIGIIVGYGPIGRSVLPYMETAGFTPFVIDWNLETIRQLEREGRKGIYGDAALLKILEAAHIDIASLLVITCPDIKATTLIIESARQLNENIPILARVRYLDNRQLLQDLKVQYVCCEEESIKAFSDLIEATPLFGLGFSSLHQHD